MTTINVTQQDIDKGKRNSAYRCPVALACSRETGLTIGIGLTIGVVGDGDFFLPPVVTDFVSAFDAGKEVTPFTFELALPEGHNQ